MVAKLVFRGRYICADGAIREMMIWRLPEVDDERPRGPLSIRALSKVFKRDYKNAHVDVSNLESVDLIQRGNDGLIIAPWDVIDAHARLVA